MFFVCSMIPSGMIYANSVMLFFQNSSFQMLLPIFRQRIIDSFSPEARDMFEREFAFFDKVTSISGVLYPLPKEERRAGIRRLVFYLSLYNSFGGSYPFCSSATIQLLSKKCYASLDDRFLIHYSCSS